MNELEHLRALRDKARIQTEQARAVLKQQGEISESLDRLIAALEAKEKQGAMPDLDVQPPAVSSVETDSQEQPVESLGQMIANLDDRDEGATPTPNSDSEEVVWVEEPKPIIPDLPKKPSNDAPPKLEPILWEVADSTPVPASADAAPSGVDSGDEKTFEFSKMEESDAPGDAGSEGPSPDIAPPSLDTVAIPVVDLATTSAVGAVAAKINETSEAAEPDSPSSSPAPVSIDPAPPTLEAVTPPSEATEESDAAGEESSPAANVVATNIFFDANSAYLKESELEKLRAAADCLSGGESRLIKIQGLEDLASSNDFKELLSSRRILAVKKKLTENEVDEAAIEVNEIELSEEGRILNPPAILLTATPA